MTLKEFIRRKILGLVGLSKDTTPDKEKLTFINDADRLIRTKLKEYNVWYYGDGDELLNFYTKENMFGFNTEPYYSRNKRNYFWSISSTEGDIKRTHSGQPRNIVDTLVMITRYPVLTVEGNETNKLLQTIIKDCKLKNVYKNQQLPLTLIEGWGCYKINFDKDVSDYPYIIYYRADSVDFVIKSGRIMGCVFKDYYTDGENKNYMLIETRSIKYDKENDVKYLEITKELFTTNKNGEFVTELQFEDFEKIPELAGITKEDLYVRIVNMDSLLAVPTILFENVSNSFGYGRSIFTGKIDLFDDLDQCLSQSSNTVRRSTPAEYFNSDYLERDPKTGMPKQPKVFDRKYVIVNGQRDSEGTSKSSSPVQVTQPTLNLDQYSDQAVQILMQILNGIMSPATLGIDVAKKDNAEAQREKEKVTIFTRNAIIDSETDILKDLAVQLLYAYQLMHEGKIDVWNYDITIKFSEFADDSYENKLEVLGAAFDNELLSEEMFMDKLYGQTLSEEEYEREKKWLQEHHTKPRDEGMQGWMAGKMTPQPNAEEGDKFVFDEEL